MRTVVMELVVVATHWQSAMALHGKGSQAGSSQVVVTTAVVEMVVKAVVVKTRLWTKTDVLVVVVVLVTGLVTVATSVVKAVVGLVTTLLTVVVVVVALEAETVTLFVGVGRFRHEQAFDTAEVAKLWTNGGGLACRRCITERRLTGTV